MENVGSKGRVVIRIEQIGGCLRHGLGIGTHEAKETHIVLDAAFSYLFGFQYLSG